MSSTPNSTLRAILIGTTSKGPHGKSRFPPFRTASELARKLSELPRAFYSNTKSTEAFLSQIFAGKASVPEALYQEIARCIQSIFPVSESTLYIHSLLAVVQRHNDALDREKHSAIGRETQKEVLDRAYHISSPQHVVLLSEASIGVNNDFVAGLLEVQLATLNAIDPNTSSHSHLLYITNTAEDSGAAVDDVLWKRSPDEVSFTYLAESKNTAFALWALIFDLVFQDEELDCDDARISANKTDKLLSQKHVTERLRIFYLPAPLNAVCSAPVVALNPHDIDSAFAYSLVNGWAVQYSKEEMRAWRSLIYGARGEFMGNAVPCVWAEVRAGVFRTNHIGI